MAITTTVSPADSLSITASTESVPATVTDLYLSSPENEEGEEEVFDDLRVAHTIFGYVSPVVIFVCVFGNTLSLAVLQSKYFRRAPSSFVLSALALVDTGVLLTGLSRNWISAITNGRVDIRQLSLVNCKIHFFFTYFLKQLSPWTLVLMTIERLVSVISPMKAREICSRRRMVIAWFVIVAGLFALNSYAFVILGEVTRPVVRGGVATLEKSCFYKWEEFYFARFILPWIDMVFGSIAPAIIIFTLNIIIVYNVVRASRNRSEQMSATGGEDTTQSLTAMLIAISIVFLVTTTPATIYIAGLPLWPYTTRREQYRRNVAYTAVILIFYFNNCLNFFLYCLSGSEFRRALVAVLCCRKKQAKGGSQTTTTTRSRKPTISSDANSTHEQNAASTHI